MTNAETLRINNYIIKQLINKSDLRSYYYRT